MEEFKPKYNRSPVVEIKIGAAALHLTYFNTTLYSYDNFDKDIDHSQVQHIYTTGAVDSIDIDDNPGTYLFNCPELFDQLDDLKFPHMVAPFPTSDDLDVYVKFQIDELATEHE